VGRHIDSSRHALSAASHPVNLLRRKAFNREVREVIAKIANQELIFKPLFAPVAALLRDLRG
jgi:hypothetical protein